MVIEVRTLGVKECSVDGCTIKPYARALCKKHHQWLWKRNLLPERRLMSIRDRILTYGEPIPEAGCWIWTMGISTAGYGYLAVGGGKRMFAHRAAYEEFKGPIGPGLEVCHKCDTPACCNPDHLFLGTHKENMQDSSRKGRSRNRPVYGFEHPCSVLTVEQLETIRSSKVNAIELAKNFGVNPETIRRARRGETYAR